MKQFLNAIFLLTLSICTSLSAQTFLGISGGINTSSFSGDAPPNAQYKFKLGYSAGIEADFTLTEDVILSFQPRFIERGTDISYEKKNFETVDSLSATLNYFSSPILLKIFALNKKIYFSSGFDFGYLTSANAENLIDGSTKNVDNLFKKYDLSIAFGFGMNFPIGITLLSSELRYSQSLMNISDISSEEEANIFPYRFRTSGFQLLVSFLYPI